MKKIFCLLLASVLLFSAALSVFATEITALNVDVEGAILPVSGEKASQDLEEDLKAKILIETEGDTDEMEVPVFEAYWTEADRGDVKLSSSDLFVAGRTYRLVIVLDFSSNAVPKIDGDTKFTVNTTEGKHNGNKGDMIEFYCDFVATPGDYTPKVSLNVEGEKTKEYDGKGITLSAAVEKTEGVEYRYAWYRDGALVEGENKEKLVVKNVSDSGEYYVEVTAALSSDVSFNAAKKTKSASQKITVTPHVVTVEIHDAEKNLFDPDPKFTYDLLGEVYDDLTGALTRLEGEDIGKYSILIGTLGFPEEAAENYEIRVEQGTLTIIDVGKLPFATVNNLADQSYITGKSGAKIRVSATRSSIPEGAILSLTLPSANAKKDLEEALSSKLMKSFTVELIDEAGKKLSLPRHATIRIQIPLAEEEEKFDPNTITAGLLDSSATSLETKVFETSAVTYITVEIESLGTVALFEGKVASEEKTPEGNGEKKEEKGGALWMWILIGVISLAAVGVIVFVIIKVKNDKKNEKKPEKGEKIDPSRLEEKEKAARIAEHLNTLPPVPEKKPVSEKAMETRVVGAQVPALSEEKTEEPSEEASPEPEAEKDAKRVISFEDLED